MNRSTLPKLDPRRALALSAALACAVVLLSAPTAPKAQPPTLLTGFTDDDAYQGPPANRTAAIEHTLAARGSVVRVLAFWSITARSQPPDRAAARDPAFLGYNWENLDPVIRDLSAAGLRVVISTTSAPSWAEGPGRPPVSQDAPPGTWMPSAEAFGDFARALAERYSGRYPDPERPGAMLPRVRDFQGWNEPNLSNFLTPQWRKTGSGYTAASPDHYRNMLGAFYEGIKSVEPSNVVVSAGTAPYGERRPGARRMPPAQFTRHLLCVNGRRQPRAMRRCPSPVKFDVLAHNPYPIGPPRRHAPNPDDVVVPDFDRLTRPMNAALRAGFVYPRRRKQVWATEISWDSSPPDPDGVPARVHARYAAGALHILWQQGVSVVAWWRLRDEAVGKGYPYTLQSGIYERRATVAEDRPKLAFEAFRFPFTAYVRRGAVRLWGLAPGGGTVIVEAKAHGGWRRVGRLRARGNRLFTGSLRGVRKKQILRARQGAESSLPWRVV